MAFTAMPTIYEKTRLRSHLQETLDELPNNLPRYDEIRLLDGLTFLLQSPLFLYAVSSRILKHNPQSNYEPPTPMSINYEDTGKQNEAFDISNLEIRIKWSDDNWVAQLSYGDNVLLEGRELDAEQETGFVQSFFWFCEEAAFLAYEYKAREHACKVRQGAVLDTEPLENTVVEDGRWRELERSGGRDEKGRRSLMLKIRTRSTARGRADVWRMERRSLKLKIRLRSTTRGRAGVWQIE